MRRFVGSNRLDEAAAEVNLTPMLDIVFIMLIFFIVTATFIREQGLAVNPPDDNQQVQSKPDNFPVVIRISSSDRITIADQDTDVRAVQPVLARLYAQNPDATFIVQSHAKAHTRTMVHVMDIARLVGIEKVSLATP